MGFLNKLGNFLTNVEKKLDEKLAEYEQKEQEIVNNHLKNKLK